VRKPLSIEEAAEYVGMRSTEITTAMTGREVMAMHKHSRMNIRNAAAVIRVADLPRDLRWRIPVNPERPRIQAWIAHTLGKGGRTK
jgi:hypothetical protein